MIYRMVGDWEKRRRVGENASEDDLLEKMITFLCRACQKCRIKDSDEILVQGLPSGVRATDLINTLLNMCYCIIADEVIAECGLEPMGMTENCSAGLTNLFQDETENGNDAANGLHI